MPIFSTLGANCTVLDYSEKQLASEQLVAERENYDINIVRADMTQPLPFDENYFDLIFHPVSNCYIRICSSGLERVLPNFKSRWHYDGRIR